MNAKEHIKFSYYSLTVLIGGGIIYHQYNRGVINIDLESALSLLVGVGVGSLLPDIDHPKSIAGSIIPLHHMRHVASIFKHGGITHTYLINIWLYIIAYFLGNWLLYGIAFGYFTHLYADDITGNTLPMKWYPLNNLFERKSTYDKRRKNSKPKQFNKRNTRKNTKTK